jgi:C1A family cysteine protease
MEILTMTEYRMDGWKKQEPDSRDFTIDNPAVEKLLMSHLPRDHKGALRLPTSANLMDYLPPVVHQGGLGSCTANAAACLLEANRIVGGEKPYNPSRLFIYYYSRLICSGKVEGDNGSSNRATMKALAKYGAPPNWMWRYIESLQASEPTWLSRKVAEKHQVTEYLALVRPADPKQPDVLDQIKAQILKKRPILFGTPMFDSMKQSTNGDMYYPSEGDPVVGNHAMVVVGYEDRMTMTNPITKHTSRGAFLVRNSWGPEWGFYGYGYMPYEFINHTNSDERYMEDLWVIVEAER